MKISHQTAFQWMLDEMEGQLDPAHHQALKTHFEECEQCARDASMMGWLASPTSESSLSRLSDRQIVRDIYAGLHRRIRLGLFQGGLWAVAVFALLVLFTWIIDQFNPNVVFAASLLGSAARPAALSSSEPWVLGSLVFFSGFIAPILAGAVGLFMARRQAVGGWLTFLVVILALAFGFFFYGVIMTMRGNALYTIADLPFIIFIVAALLAHLWEFRTYWPRITWGLLGLFGAAILVAFLIPWWDELNSTLPERLYTLGFMLTIAAILTLAWKGWEWRGGWRWLGMFILGLAGVVTIASLLIVSPFLFQRYPWLQGTLSLGSLIWTFLATLLAARLLLYNLRPPQTANIGRRLVAGLVFALCFVSLYLDIYQMALTNSTSEDAFTGTIMIWMVCIATMLASVWMGWRLSGWRVWAATAVMLLFLGGLIPATIIPNGITAAITEQRVEQVNQAVLRYQAENGHYPTSLAALEPRYLLQVPPPITAFRKSWCYRSGTDYYELGYYDAFLYNYPGYIQVKNYASVGPVPSGLSDCEKALLDAIH